MSDELFANYWPVAYRCCQIECQRITERSVTSVSGRCVVRDDNKRIGMSGTKKLKKKLESSLDFDRVIQGVE